MVEDLGIDGDAGGVWLLALVIGLFADDMCGRMASASCSLMASESCFVMTLRLRLLIVSA